MALDINNQDGAQAREIQSFLDYFRGTAIVSGCDASPGANALETDVASGTARVGGTDVSVSAQTVTHDAGSADPRKDLVYIDGTGTAQILKGSSAPAEPAGNTRFQTYVPAIPDGSSITGAAVAAVWVPANHSSTFSSGDIKDQRVISNLDVHSADIDDENNTRMADPGNIQSQLDTVGNLPNVGYGDGLTRGKVKVRPNTIWDPGQTTNVPVGVTLDASDALFDPSADYDGVFLDNAAHAYVNAITDRNYTSRVVYVSTAESSQGRYTDGQQGGTAQGGAYANVRHWGDPNNTGTSTELAGGETVAFIDDAGGGISVVPWDVKSYQVGTNVRADVATGGYVNTPVHLNSQGLTHTNVRITGSDASYLRTFGKIGVGQEYGLHNEIGDSGHIIHTGSFWDVTNASTWALAGPRILVNIRGGGQEPINWPGNGYADGSPFQLVRAFMGGSMQTYSGRNDSSVKLEFEFGSLRIDNNGTEVIRIEDNRVFLNQDLDMGTTQRVYRLPDGGSSVKAVEWDSGAGFYKNSSGEIVAVDDAGNETTLT